MKIKITNFDMLTFKTTTGNNNIDVLRQTREKEKKVSKVIKERYDRQCQKVWSETFERMEAKWRQEHNAKIAHFKNIYQQLLLAQGEAQKRAESETENFKTQNGILLSKLEKEIVIQESRFEKGLEEVRKKQAEKFSQMKAKKALLSRTREYGEMVRSDIMPNMATIPYAKELGIVDPEEQENVPTKTPHHKVNLDRLKDVPKAIRYDSSYFPQRYNAVGTRDHKDSAALGPSAMSLAFAEENKARKVQDANAEKREKYEKSRELRYNKALQKIAMEKAQAKMLKELEALAETDKAARKDTAVSATWMDEAKTRQKRFHQFQNKLESEFERRFVDQASKPDELIRRKKSEISHANDDAGYLYELDINNSPQVQQDGDQHSSIESENLQAKDVAIQKQHHRSIHIHVNTPEPRRRMEVPRPETPPNEKSPFKRTFRPILRSTSELNVAFPTNEADKVPEMEAEPEEPFIVIDEPEIKLLKEDRLFFEDLSTMARNMTTATAAAATTFTSNIKEDSNFLQSQAERYHGIAASSIAKTATTNESISLTGVGSSSTSSFAESTPSSIMNLLDSRIKDVKGKQPISIREEDVEAFTSAPAVTNQSSIGSTPHPMFRYSKRRFQKLSTPGAVAGAGNPSVSSSTSSFVLPSELLDSDFSLPTTFSSPVSSEISMRSLKSLLSEMEAEGSGLLDALSPSSSSNPIIVDQTNSSQHRRRARPELTDDTNSDSASDLLDSLLKNFPELDLSSASKKK